MMGKKAEGRLRHQLRQSEQARAQTEAALLDLRQKTDEGFRLVRSDIDLVRKSTDRIEMGLRPAKKAASRATPRKASPAKKAAAKKAARSRSPRR